MAGNSMEVALRCPSCGRDVGLDVAFCASCGGAVGTQCPRCARQCRTGDRFCALCGADLAPEGVNSDDEPTRRAERKLVSIVFIDMVGFTSLGHHHDAETVKGAMTAFFRRLAAVAREHGGYVEKFIGDAMMTVFGAPTSREDDAIRALNAAIEMHRALDEVNAIYSARFKRSIQIRVGVNTGIAIAGAIGEGRATDYGVSGDVVNVASRLQSAADPGETVIGETTRELGGRGFLYASIAPLTLKGKPEPVPAFRLLGRSDSVTELFEHVPLIGRDQELAQLRDIAQLVQAGGAAAVAVRGPSGAGKSRMLDALRRDESAASAAWIAPSATDAPLSLARGIARSLARDGDDAATVARRVLGADDALALGLAGRLLSDDGAVDDSAIASLDAATRNSLLADLLGRLAAESPAPPIIAIDDAEQADRASLTVLAEMLATGAFPALVVTTSDTAWEPPWGAVAEIALDDLDSVAMESILVAALGEEEIGADARARIAEAAAGNPLALAELVWAFRATGEVPRPRSGGVAGTLLALVQSRIDAVDEEARAALRVGSVIGQTFDPAVIARVLDRESIAEPLERLRRRNLVQLHDGTVRFAQAAIRDVAYESLLRAERARLHGRVAQALETLGADDPILLASHWRRSDERDRAVGTLCQAAEARLASGDVAGALEDLRDAQSRFGSDEELGAVTRADVGGRIADLVALMGDLDAAVAEYAAAIAPLANGLPRAALLRRQALVELRRRDDDAALDALQSARDDITLAELDGNEPVEAIFTALAALSAVSARAHFTAGRLDESTWESRQALEMLSHLNLEQAAEANARRTAADANLVLAEALIDLGDGASAAEHADSARAGYAELRDLAMGLRADLAIARTRGLAGNRAEARARIEGCLALARRLGDRDAMDACSHALTELGVVVL